MTPALKTGRHRARPNRLRRWSLVPVLIVTVTALFWSGHQALAYPATPPGLSTTRAHLATLTVAPPHPMTGYSRTKFPHWHAVSGSCNTRETVLKRDGTGVTVNSACYPTAGRWYSVYDKKYFTAPSEVSIDHVVALANAWRSGADTWTTSRRETFANDLDSQQLIAVGASINSSKGDQSPDQWMPPNTNNWCIYARSWINVKYVWDLNVTSAEKATLEDVLDGSC
jgi:hypothetical protein